MKFCIVGTGRSGTTLLWRMMNAHPDLFVFRETHWIPALHEAFGTRTVPTARLLDLVARTRHVTGDPTTVFDLDAFRACPGYRPEMTVRGFSDALGAFHAAAAGKAHWADKTPDYGYFLPELQLYWPGCRIVHAIRDGVQTAASMARHIGFRALAAAERMHWCPLALDYHPPEDGFPSRPAERYADLWHDRLLRIRDAQPRLAPGSYLEVRHEDTLADPEGQLRRIAEFVGLPAPGPWLAEAAGFIERGRGLGRRDGRVPDWFSPKHRALLAELGYDAGGDPAP